MIGVGPVRLSIGTRMLGGFLAVVVLIGAIVATAIVYFSRLESSLQELFDEEIPEVHTLWEIRSRLVEIEVKLYDILDRRQLGSSAAAIAHNQEAAADLLGDYVKLHHAMSPEIGQIVFEFEESLGRLEASAGKALALAGQERWEEADSAFRGETKERIGGALRDLDRMLAFENDEVDEQSVRALAAGASGRSTLTVLLLAGLAVSVVLSLLLTRSLTRPIMRLVASTESAASGDLSVRAEVGGWDEIGQLAERFNDMLDRLEKSLADQKRFYADASHELRTPVTVIRGESEVALRGPESLESYREALQNIAAAAGQLTFLVDELLFLSRSEAGQVEYHMRPLGLMPLLREVVDLSEGLAGIKGVTLQLGEIPFVDVEGDHQRLRQLFLNLLDNAIKYTPAGGHVAVTGIVRSDEMVVEVADTGIGMAAEEVPRVFERFYRGEIAKSARAGGTGLGLSIANSIARAHGGRIDVDSETGKGTRIAVTLPRPLA
jgi:signal transduction histidine kinase